MLLFIDNYDSFTYNLVHYFGQAGADMKVIRNDEATVDEIWAMNPKGIVLSPGPCTPNEAGVCLDLTRSAIEKRIPLFGVCLGHQAIGQVFGGKVVRAKEVMHGKMGMVEHNGTSVFADLPSPLEATRYHSLVIEPGTLPDEIEITATIEGDDTIMGIRHNTLPIHGVQFHPESIASQYGHEMIENFVKIMEDAYVGS